jgi:transposase
MMPPAPDGVVLPLPDARTFACLAVLRHTFGYVITLAGRQPGCACQKCGVVSGRVHARYERRVRDLPIQGERVLVRLRCRKFVCRNPRCAQRIFCERFGAELPAFARSTTRLEHALAALALATSANLAARLGRILGLPGSARSILRAAHRFEPPVSSAARIAVDDFAFRRGRSYGTIIVDLDTRRPIELLPDRGRDRLVAYLEAHPEVDVVTRDRDPRYAEAIRLAAPGAIAIADRWHLIRNLADAFERLVARSQRAWRQELQAALTAERPSGDSPVGVPLLLPRPTRLNAPSPAKLAVQAAKRAERQRTFDQVHALRRDGWSLHRIAAHAGIERETVRTYLRRERPPDWSRARPTASPLDAHHAFLARRWREGCRNAALLQHELATQGYRGSLKSVQRYVHAWRDTPPPEAAATSPPVVILPPSRTLAWRLLQNDPDPTTQDLLRHVRDAEHHTNLARAGVDNIRRPNLDAWTAWCKAIRAGPENPLRRFVITLDTDRDAVHNALVHPHSNGPAEGNVNRLKLLKRSSYGRASFELLRKKVLHQLP